MLRFARKVAGNAAAISASEVADLKSSGFSDAEIFDIAATATARTFFAQLCEGLGAIGDHLYEDMDAQLRDALVVGRPLECSEPERLAERIPVRAKLDGTRGSGSDAMAIWPCANSG
jgi:hypothetical protein